MAAITGSTIINTVPYLGKKMIYVETPSTADSNDTIDLSGVLDSIDLIYAYDQDTGDQVTATESSCVVTIDASGGTTNHTYALLVVGE